MRIADTQRNELDSIYLALTDAEARGLWDELWAAGKTPEEIAKGRDLSPDAHRRVWTALFARADRVAPGLSRALYERVMDPNSWVPFADTPRVLRALRERGLRIGVVSNVPAVLRPVFAKHGLERFVDSFTHSFEVGAEKPDPAIFLAAARSLRLRPEEILMVGDHAVDAGAERAGMRVFILPEKFDWSKPAVLDEAMRTMTNALRPWTNDFHVAQNDATVKGSGSHDKTGKHCLPNDPNGKLNIAHHAGFWLRDDKGNLTRAVQHICWDGCMFPNETMMRPETWKSVLGTMIAVRNAHGWD